MGGIIIDFMPISKHGSYRWALSILATII